MPEFIVRVGTTDGTITERHVQAIIVRAAEEELRQQWMHAFASYGDAFPPIYSTSLRAGERSGDLEGVLRRFLRYQKIIVNLRKRVIGAMIYPSVLIVLSVGMVFVMLTKVIPKFAEFYEGFGKELPPFTRFM